MYVCEVRPSGRRGGLRNHLESDPTIARIFRYVGTRRWSRINAFSVSLDHFHKRWTQSSGTYSLCVKLEMSLWRTVWRAVPSVAGIIDREWQTKNRPEDCPRLTDNQLNSREQVGGKLAHEGQIVGIREGHVCLFCPLSWLSIAEETSHFWQITKFSIANINISFLSVHCQTGARFSNSFFLLSTPEFIFAPNFQFFMLDPVCNPAFCVPTNISSRSSQIYSGWRARASLVANPLFLRFPFILRTPFDCNRSAYKSYSVQWRFLNPLCSFRLHFGAPKLYRIRVQLMCISSRITTIMNSHRIKNNTYLV